MAYLGAVRRWDLFTADLDYPVGSEQGGEARPVLVVSNDGFNQHFPVVTVLPLTKREGKARRVYPYEVELPAQAAGNPLASIEPRRVWRLFRSFRGSRGEEHTST